MSESSSSPAVVFDRSADPEERRRWAALIVVCTGALMIVLDTTIVNVALPVIQDDLGFSQSSLTWLINAYLISFGSFLLLAGRLGDMFGRKRMFLSGLILFVAASIVCGVASGQEILIAGRFLQGLGGAFASASVLAIIVTEFPEAKAQARAMSIYMFVAIAGGSIGLLLGGILTQSLSWHWIFFINVPVGIVTWLAGVKLIDESKTQGVGEGIDYLGSVLVTIGVAVGVYAIVGVTDNGWASAETLGLLAVSAALLAGFLLLESRIKNAIMPLRILRIRTLNYSHLVRGSLVVGAFSTFFLGALYLERVRGYAAIDIGFAFLPWTVAMGALSLGPTAKLMGRFSHNSLVLASMPLVLGALIALSTVDANTGYFPKLFVIFVAMGLGFGLGFTPLMTLSMRDVPEADAGLGSGMVNVTMQIAGAFGLAVLSTIAADKTQSSIANGVAEGPAFVDGFQLACIVSAGIVAIGMVLMLIASREPKRADAKTSEAVTESA